MVNSWKEPDCARRAVVNGIIAYYADWQIIPWEAQDVEFRTPEDRQRFVTREVVTLDHRDEELTAWRSAQHLTSFVKENTPVSSDTSAEYLQGYKAGQGGATAEYNPYKHDKSKAKAWDTGRKEAIQHDNDQFYNRNMPVMRNVITGAVFLCCLFAPVIYGMYRFVHWLLM